MSLPKGTPVVILLQAMHMHPDYWDEPEAFEPGRWIRAEDTSAMRTASDNGTRSAFIPFLVRRPKLLHSVSFSRRRGEVSGCGCAGWPAAVCGSVPGGAGVRCRAARSPPGTHPTQPVHCPLLGVLSPCFLRKSVTRCACVQRLDFSAMSFPPDEEMPLVSDPYPTFRDPPQLTVRLRAAATS